MGRESGRHRTGGEVVHVPGFAHLGQTPGGQVAEDRGHVDVLLDGGLQEAAAEGARQQLRLLRVDDALVHQVDLVLDDDRGDLAAFVLHLSRKGSQPKFVKGVEVVVKELPRPTTTGTVLQVGVSTADKPQLFLAFQARRKFDCLVNANRKNDFIVQLAEVFKQVFGSP